jgi:hypothetical protein
MANFAALTGFGIVVGGATEINIAPQQGWPTVMLVTTYSAADNSYHATLPAPITQSPLVSFLARCFRTAGAVNNQWYAQLRLDHQNANPYDNVALAPFAQAIWNLQEVFFTYDDVAAALVASAYAQQFPDPAADFAWPWMNFPIGMRAQVFPPIVMYDQGTQPRTAGVPRLRNRLYKASRVGNEGRDRTLHSQTPTVPRWMEMSAALNRSVRPYSVYTLPAVALEPEVIRYVVNVNHALRYAEDLKAHLDYFMHPQAKVFAATMSDIARLWKTEGRTVEVEATLYLGTAGCGKTTALKTYMAALEPEELANFRVVSHTQSLRAELKEKLDFPSLRGFNFPTLVSLLTEPSSGTLAFDDAGKFEGGLLDLLLLCNPLVEAVVVNGDPAQGLKRFPYRGTQSFMLPTLIERVAQQSTKYATISHRQFQVLAHSIGMHTTNPVMGFMQHVNGGMTTLPTLTASPRYVGVLAGGGRIAYTYEEVQGEDFKTPVEVDLTGLEAAISDRTSYVATTRSNAGVYLHMEAADPRSVIRQMPSGSPVLNAWIFEFHHAQSPRLVRPVPNVKAAFYAHLHQCMPNYAPFAAVSGTTVQENIRELMSMPEYSVPQLTEAECEELSETTPRQAAVDAEILAEYQMWDKPDRETREGNQGATSQFRETAVVDPHVHRRTDRPTFAKSVDARLTKVGASTNRQKFESTDRRDLIDQFDAMVPYLPAMDLDRLLECGRASLEDYMSTRTASTLQHKLDSVDPVRLASQITISLKAQVIKKAEKRVKKEAVPGQLIHEFDLVATLSDGAYARYLEMYVLPAFPASCNFYYRMNPEKFVQQYKDNWVTGRGSYSSDVTRWDVGCDATVLHFDAHVMRRAGFPEEYVLGYIERRLTTTTQFGDIATIQNSGDRFTWVLNTLRRAVVTFYVTSPDGDTHFFFNGDDATADKPLMSRQLENSPWLFKDETGSIVEFSGYEMGHDDPRYSGLGLYYRCAILRSRNTTQADRWEAYLVLSELVSVDDEYLMPILTMCADHLSTSRFSQLLSANHTHLFSD